MDQSKTSSHISDPTDWLQSKIPNLSNLDSLLRCFICKEYLKAPIITGCSHTFCSHCIRECLIKDSRCPLCHTEQHEYNLKRIILLEEIVLCFSNIRNPLLECIRSDPVPAPVPAPVKRPAPEIIDLDSEDSSFKRRASASPVQQKKMKVSSIPVTRSPAKAIPERLEMVECPVCQEIMSAEELQVSHIDNCLSGVPVKPPQSARKEYSKTRSISSFFKPRPTTEPLFHSVDLDARSATVAAASSKFYFNETSMHHHTTKKLPMLDYSSLSTTKLKEKLQILKISTAGTRIQLELRYNQYYILFNSNLDSNHPISERELRSKLHQWESNHSAFNPTSLISNIGVVGRMNINDMAHKNINDKNFSVREWKLHYRDEFRELVQQAKSSLTSKTLTKTVENNSSETKKTEDDGQSVVEKNNLKEGDDSGAIPQELVNSRDGSIDNLNFRSQLEQSPLFSNINTNPN